MFSDFFSNTWKSRGEPYVAQHCIVLCSKLLYYTALLYWSEWQWCNIMHSTVLWSTVATSVSSRRIMTVTEMLRDRFPSRAVYWLLASQFKFTCYGSLSRRFWPLGKNKWVAVFKSCEGKTAGLMVTTGHLTIGLHLTPAGLNGWGIGISSDNPTFA